MNPSQRSTSNVLILDDGAIRAVPRNFANNYRSAVHNTCICQRQPEERLCPDAQEGLIHSHARTLAPSQHECRHVSHAAIITEANRCCLSAGRLECGGVGNAAVNFDRDDSTGIVKLNRSRRSQHRIAAQPGD